MAKIWTKLMINIFLMILILVLVEGKSPGIATVGQLCYPTYEKTCYDPDYFLHWSGMKCKYGARPYARFRESDDCWPWFYWWMEVLYVVVGIPLLLTILGIFCGPLCGSDSSIGGAHGCIAGCTLTWPCCAIPFLIWFYTSKIKCELCGEKMKAHNCIGRNEPFSHRQLCVEKNRSKYDDIPNSPKYTCKNCQTNLKLWPVELLSKSNCVKCLVLKDLEDKDKGEIVNNGSNLHVCFTCGGKLSYTTHHLCGRHTRQGTTTQVDWENLENLPDLCSPEYFQMQNRGSEGRPLIEGQPSENALPPGWKLVTNPVTGEPYGLCDPSGEIKPLVGNQASANDGIPPSYEEAVPSASSRYSWNEKLNKEATNWKNKSHIMVRQTSIEMEAAARRFRQ